MSTHFGLHFVISLEKCTPWEDVPLRFGNGFKGLNVDFLEVADQWKGMVSI
jgi:hypothetical protein